MYHECLIQHALQLTCEWDRSMNETWVWMRHSWCMSQIHVPHIHITCIHHIFTFRLFRFKFYTREDVGQYEDLNTTASGCREVFLFLSLITWIDSVMWLSSDGDVTVDWGLVTLTQHITSTQHITKLIEALWLWRKTCVTCHFCFWSDVPRFEYKSKWLLRGVRSDVT